MVPVVQVNAEMKTSSSPNRIEPSKSLSKDKNKEDPTILKEKDTKHLPIVPAT